jgi:hypothetical protein
MNMKAKATTGKATRATETILAEERMGRGRATIKVGWYLRRCGVDLTLHVSF